MNPLTFFLHSIKGAALRRGGAEGCGRPGGWPALLAVLFVAAAALPPAARSQALLAEPLTPTTQYEPQVGQAGKDVVWVPTHQALVDRMLDMAKVTAEDYLIDLGSGDGRTVITAAQRGLRAHGIEYNPEMVELARRNAEQAGVADRATFEKADLFQSDFSRAQVITMFLLPSINEKLRPIILELKPGTRIVSNTFTMGPWEADEKVTIEDGCWDYCTALMWIVPAKVDGSWQLGGEQLKLRQHYQTLTGTLGSMSISDGRLRGDQITFTVGEARYTGTVRNGSMSGSVTGAAQRSWSAVQM